MVADRDWINFNGLMLDRNGVIGLGFVEAVSTGPTGKDEDWQYVFQIYLIGSKIQYEIHRKYFRQPRDEYRKIAESSRSEIEKMILEN